MAVTAALSSRGQGCFDKDPQAVIAEAEAILRRMQGKYEAIANRRQVIDALEVHIV
jgi:hypothetical protein